jgi:hypothetical protein
MAEYRRRKDKDTWHWCRNCRNDPKSDYIVYSGAGKPTYGELCNECQAKVRDLNCKQY